ncbi:protein phosphatase regulator [Podospora pseudopauciseta]|uniref:Protein phosphatase regulator n=1 Tax=Podospora pseudopauciseta TaxID=2093780 RepID=A0ABR0HPI0_9PEZI|nr:protein phosphatase regulator [Podospora pseudopauciseta]
MADQDHDTLISNFCDLTGASTDQATEYLTATNWDVNTAAAAFYGDLDENEQGPSSTSAATATTTDAEYTGPRTLDGRPAPEYAGTSSSTSKKPVKRRGLATLSSIGGGRNQEDDDDDDDESDDDNRRGPRDLFAGGEKSGLAVQDPAQRSSDPRKLINDIVAKARANATESNPASSPAAGPSSSRFSGSGQTLGGDGVESRTIPSSRAAGAVPEGPAQERILHIWRDGFSIDDGELRRFDDPQNRSDLDMIRNGRAPIHLMNVRMDQRVDVKLQQHDENYRPLPKIYRPFGGEGRRLGSPVPGEVTPTLSPPAATTTQPQASQALSTGVDESQPTLMLRIQLPDGTRMPARFNPTQTVGDVYNFIGRSSSSLSARPWVLSTTFPNKDHEDKGLVLGDMPEFKKGGAAVVKWK